MYTFPSKCLVYPSTCTLLDRDLVFLCGTKLDVAETPVSFKNLLTTHSLAVMCALIFPCFPSQRCSMPPSLETWPPSSSRCTPTQTDTMRCSTMCATSSSFIRFPKVWASGSWTSSSPPGPCLKASTQTRYPGRHSQHRQQLFNPFRQQKKKKERKNGMSIQSWVNKKQKKSIQTVNIIFSLPLSQNVPIGCLFISIKNQFSLRGLHVLYLLLMRILLIIEVL